MSTVLVDSSEKKSSTFALKLYRKAASALRNFESKEELNEHVAAHIERAGKRLPPNYRAIANILAQHAFRFHGVAWLRPKTILKKHNSNLGNDAKPIKVVKTINRALDRLQDLGIIQLITIPAGEYTLTFYRFKRFDFSAVWDEFVSNLSSVKSELSPDIPMDETLSKTDELIELKDLNKDDDDQYITLVHKNLNPSFSEMTPAKEVVEVVMQEEGIPDEMIAEVVEEMKENDVFPAETIKQAVRSYRAKLQRLQIGRENEDDIHTFGRWFIKTLKTARKQKIRQVMVQERFNQKHNIPSYQHDGPFTFYNWLEEA